MGFWLATLNPGKSRVRRGRKRRKLSAWQRAVKKHGGVMQAVKAARSSKRKRRGGRRRRNPFLTTALTSGGAKVLMNATRRKRRRSKIRTRRSVLSRGSLRGRSRRASSSRRSKMARKTRRRRLSRGRGGRFVGRRTRRGGRRRRNPVLPISWNPRRRRRRSRRNPLWRSRRTGKFKGSAPGRRLHMRRRRPRVWHNNPIALNPRRRRRSYRRNPVLPISWNPGGILSLRGGPLGAITQRLGSFVDVKFWTQTGVPAATGFFASKAAGTILLEAVSKFVPIPPVAQPYAKMGSDAVAGAGLAWLVGRFYSKQAGDAVWLGAVVNVAHALLKQLVGGTEIARKIGLDGLGDDIAERMKQAIAARVQNGMGAYLRNTNVLPQRGVGEYVTDRNLRMQPSYAGGPAADLRDYDIANQETGI